MTSVEIVRYVIVPLAVAGIGMAGYIISKKAQKGSREDALIDNLEARVDAQGKDIAALKKEMIALKGRELRLMDYTNELRKHINAELGPPPPPWPEGLYQ